MPTDISVLPADKPARAGRGVAAGKRRRSRGRVSLDLMAVHITVLKRTRCGREPHMATLLAKTSGR